MTVIARLRQDHLDAMIRHALEDAPVECCGQIAVREGAITRIHPAVNAENSHYRFSIDFKEQRRIQNLIDEDGDELGGFYHSHTGSEARPSPTDVRSMGPLFGPPYVHFVIGVADPEAPVVRVFHIEDGAATEHEFEVVA